MKVFHRVPSIPAHSCLMFDDRAEALNYPRRDLALGFCRSCGFIANVIFDVDAPDYGSRYEEQQSFSRRFSAFQTGLTSRLVDRYDLHGKNVVEIGCGKGDFLLELCEAGGNRGVGIDPSCDPGRMNGRGAGRVRFIQDYFSDSHAEMPCDFLCCRHTLEHIHATNEFIGRMRRFVGERKNTILFFEVPDVERVLAERAFWDIYYEHCSYFTLGSLARVFRANAFDVVELARDYDDQYLLIIARPVDARTDARLPEEDDLRRVTESVGEFAAHVGGQIDDWRAQISHLRGRDMPIVLWGSGSKCVSFLSTLDVDDQIDAVVDINPHRQGKFLPGSGREVVAPGRLRAFSDAAVIVMNPIYRDEVRQQLDEMRIRAELITV